VEREGHRYNFQKKLEQFTGKWLFLVLVVFVGTFVPPMATRPFEQFQAREVVLYILSHSLVHSLAPFYPCLTLWPWFSLCPCVYGGTGLPGSLCCMQD
jgi:hypothetical protein